MATCGLCEKWRNRKQQEANGCRYIESSNTKLNKMEEDKNSQQNLDNSNEELHISDVSDEVCPECGETIIEKWSGVKCSKCDWWFCY